MPDWRWLAIVFFLALACGSAAGPAQPAEPYRVVRQVELFEFRPDKVTYTCSALLEMGAPEPIAPVVNPAWRGEDPLDVQVEGPWKLEFVDEQDYPGDPRYAYQAVVVSGTRAFQPGERVPITIRLTVRDMPILHRHEGRSRYLSLVMEPEPGVERQTVLIAFPDPPGPVEVADTPPTEVRELTGWRLYRYELAGEPGAVMHLGFDLVEPPCPLPSLEDLLHADPTGRR